MKRAASAVVALGMAAMVSTPAFAASQTGAVQMKWNVAATASLNLATNYSATGLQQTTANSLQPSAAGVCASQAAETAFTMTFGPLTPSATTAVGCNYQKAVSATVVTNDSLGYKIQEWLDQAPTAGVQFCAFTNGSSATAGPASVNTVAPAAIAGSTCAAGGALLPAGSAAAGTAPGNPGTASLRTSTAPATPYTWASTTAATANTIWGEDVQLNLAANQASNTSDTSFIIISLIPN
ncbi:MAG: hypothetical protein NVSMB5_21600 [Candidatus Velthaea sp.]